ncbi:MAG: bacillithiol biosynthesis BshC [Gemmatimonadaceae bacterium]|nr:bacillithiol biosynthesis BshC [Gemmatimonadaceae bacterium]
MRVITEPFGGTALTRAYLARSAPAGWYQGGESAREFSEFLVGNARAVASEFNGTDWLARLSGAFGLTSGAPAHARMQRASNGGLVVTTGQQPGLFGGPGYTFAKALTALALADELEKLTGVPVAPVFWAATDDADFAESSSIVVPSGDGALELRVEKRDEVQRPLADEPLPEMGGVLDEFLRGVGSSSNSPIVDLVRSAYGAGATVGGAYVYLLRGILEPLGIAVLDAAHPEVRAVGHPLLTRALVNADKAASALSERAAAIKAAGFKTQVREVAGRSLVFRYSATGKERIPVASAGAEAARATAGELGATVLLRPIMERAILPTAAYVAGPAEIAYFAQVSAVADALGVAQPVAVPRWSGTVIEPRVDRILAKYVLTPSDFADPHALETTRAKASIPAELMEVVGDLRDAAAAAGKARAMTGGLVPETVITGLQRDIDHRLERFQRRLGAAMKQSGTRELRDIAAARASLYPFGKPQERAVSFVALLARYGDDLQSKMLEGARAHVTDLL